MNNEIQESEELISETPDTGSEDTRHEAHEHAHKRLYVGIGAVALLVLGLVIWSLWGDEIHEACFGEAEACEVEISPDLLNGSETTFDIEDDAIVDTN